jgi:hypothetical protein
MNVPKLGRCVAGAFALSLLAACAAKEAAGEEPLHCTSPGGALVHSPAPPDEPNGVHGNMFDVRATRSVAVRGLTANLPAGATAVEVKIFHREGSYVGHETSEAGWTLAGTTTVDAASSGPTAVPIALDVQVRAGRSHAFYVTTTGVATSGNAIVEYATGTTQGGVAVEDANLRLLQGHGVSYPFGSGGTFASRVYVGSVSYVRCD